MSTVSLVVGLLNMFCGLLIIGISIPLLKRRVKMNHLYGVRFKKSFESDELWYELNEYGARQLIIWSVILVFIGAGTLFLPLENSIFLAVLAGSASAILLIPCIVTYRYSKTL